MRLIENIPTEIQSRVKKLYTLQYTKHSRVIIIEKNH